MAIQHNPLDLSKQYLGPRALLDVKRYVTDFSSNSAPSYVPTKIYQDSLQNLHKNVETWNLRRPVNKDLWTDIAPDLRNHIDCRIQLFFQQLMLVYMTKLSFAFYNRADFQAGGEGMKGAAGRYVAAHDSTLPTLRLAQKEIRGDSVSFAKDSYFYRTWNMTTYLPEIANQIDSSIDRSLREPACKILNQVAAGDMTPLAGLDDFVTIFLRSVTALAATEKKQIAVILLNKEVSPELKKITDSLLVEGPSPHEEITVESLLNEGSSLGIEKNAARLYVLNSYAQAAQTYFKIPKIALAQLLCFQKEKSPVDEYFYMSAQSEMHKNFNDEMLPRKPHPIKMPDFPSDISWMNLSKAVQDVINTGRVHPTVTGMRYRNGCLLSDNVRIAALTFLIALHPLSPSERQKKISTILYAPEAALFRETVRKEISQAFYVSAQGLDAILLFILQEVVSHLSAGEEREPNVPQIPPLEFKEESKEEMTNGLAPPPIISAMKKLKTTFQQLAKRYSLTVTVKKSLKASKDETVTVVAKKYLQYLCSLSEPLQKIELDKIQRIATVKTVAKIQLSKEADAVYRAVRRQIVEVNGCPEPKNTIPAVLIHLLNDLL